MPEVKRRYYALVFLLLLALTAAFKPALEPVDWRVFEWLNTQRATWPEKFAVLDVGWDNDPATTQAYRLDLARALQALAALPNAPETVVLDVSVSSLPLGLAELSAALDALAARRTRVFAAVAVRQGFTGAVDPDFLRIHARREVYDKLTGFKFGHTELNVRGRTVWYPPCLAFSESDGAPGGCVPALPVAVADSIEAARYDRSADQNPVVVDIGSADELKRHVWTFRRDRGTIEPDAAALAHKVVVVGNLQYDRIAALGGRPGTEVVAWTLAERLAPAAGPRLTLLTSRAWLIGFTLVFSVLGVVTFSNVRRRIRAMRLNLVAVWAISLAVVLALLVLAVVGLRATLGAVYPQVSFVALAGFYAVSLAAHRARMRLRERAMREDVTAGVESEAQETWDVFISYSRTPKENAAWVAENLAGPLAAAELDGRRLRVFFDQTSIRVGTAWYFKLAEAIQGSRCFVAVYSTEYFQKDFCRFEMQKAAVRLIKDRRFVVVPIVRGEPKIPTAFDHIQTSPAAPPAEMVARVLAELKAVPKASGN